MFIDIKIKLDVSPDWAEDEGLEAPFAITVPQDVALYVRALVEGSNAGTPISAGGNGGFTVLDVTAHRNVSGRPR